jgi:protein SCO1/2
MKRGLPRLVLLLCCALPLAAVPAPLAPHSIYLLGLNITDQDGRTTDLARTRGAPTLVTMFYTSCPVACPLTIDTLRMIEDAAPAAERARLRVLLVSFDPVHDTVAALHAVAVQRELDTRRWTLARSDAAGARKLAALLGIRYRQSADGDFSHSSTIVLLDAEGRMVARTDTLGAVDPGLLAALHALPAGP